MEDIRYEKELEDALQTIQRLYMKVWGKKECVDFYAKYIQPIYREFEANTATTTINKPVVVESVCEYEAQHGFMQKALCFYKCPYCGLSW